ncbi:MAG: hypothetical protein ACOC9H_01445 [Gemmatimonadota bacterium]
MPNGGVGRGHALIVPVSLVALVIAPVLIPGCRLAPTDASSDRHLGTGRLLQANPWDVNPVREASVDGARVVYTGFRDGTWNVHVCELE